MSSGKRLPQYLAAMSISIGAVGAGNAISWTSNICEDLKHGKLNGLKMDNDDLGWSGSCMTLGAMLVCIPIGFVCEWIGRKGAALAAAVPLFLGWIMVMFANHVLMVYVGRVLVGIGGGAFCICGPLYASEISEPAIRGTLCSFFQFFLCVGVLYGNVFGYAMPTLRLFNVMCAAVPVVFVACFVFQPESPVYYMRKGKPDKAEKSLRRLRGKDYDCRGEMLEIQTSIEKQTLMVNFKEAIKKKAAIKATFICFMLMMYQKFCGINAVTFYTEEIFLGAGSEWAPHWCVMSVGFVLVVVTLFTTWAIERAGRKIMLMTSCALMATGSVLIGAFFCVKEREILDDEGAKAIGYVPIIGVNLFIIGFSLGLGPIPWLACAELFPPEVKAKCSAAAGTFNWFLAFIVSRFYLNVAAGIGNDITFFIFAAITVSAIFFAFFVIPETKGKTFEQIRTDLEGRRS